jgi:deoxyadenosine/deoxycytidine kinase
VATPDLVVYLQARTDVLLSRIEKRGRSLEKAIKPDYVREVARAYAEFFFNYSDAPLLIVDASEIDFVGNAEDRAALLEVIGQTHAGINHWSRR